MKNELLKIYYPYLRNEEVITHIEELRVKIKFLSKEIKENFRTYYISYKMNKCFLYIWFSKEMFWIYFKTDKQFKDPKSLCEDVPKGINATFNKRIKFDPDNMQYVSYLIKQSFSIVDKNA